MWNRDRVAGAVLLLVSVVVVRGAWQLPETAAADVMGPKMYPMVLAVILAGFSVALMVGRPKGKRAKVTKDTVLRGLLPIAGLLLLYVVLMPLLGFVLATVGLLVTCFRLKGERRWRLNAVVAVGSTLTIYLLFAGLLNVPLKLLPAF
jgi:putative tricarboxylic transport membrane protein